MPNRREFFKDLVSATAGMVLAGPGVVEAAARSVQTCEAILSGNAAKLLRLS
jgi:hypothetical protein